MTGRVNIGGVDIDVRADGSLLVADFRRMEDQANRFADRAAGNVKKLKTDGFDPLGRAVGDVRVQLIALASIGALAGLTAQAVKAADAFSGMRSRLSLVVGEGESLLQVEEKLAQLALKNRADLNATVSLYTRLRTSRKDLDDATTTQILDAWSKTLVISGANATEAASATLQFAQAMGSGKLQGAELTAVLENNSRASSLIAEKMGVSIGALKKLGEEGKLTTEVLVDIFANAGALDAEFAKISLTVGAAGTNFETAFTRVVGLLDQSTGASKMLAGWIDTMAQSLIAFGVSLSGPIAEAEAALKNLATAQNAVVADTESLATLHDKLAEAIKTQGTAAQDAARLEIDAVNQRIKANKELIGVYRAQATAKLAQAEGELQAKKRTNGGGLYDGGDPSSLDYLLLDVPLNEKRDTLFSTFGYPAQQIGKQGEIDKRFGNRDARLAAATAQINRDIDANRPLSAGQQALAKFNGEIADVQARLATAKLELKALNEAVAAGSAYTAPGTKPAPKTGGGGVTEKAKELAGYLSDIERLEKSIADIREASDAGAVGGSRAVVAALLEYYGAAQDVYDVLERIQKLNADGILTDADATVARDLILAEDFKNNTPELDMGDDLGPNGETGYDEDPIASKSDDPTRWDGFRESVRQAVSYGLQEGILTGDWGDSFRDILANATSDAFSRAVDTLTDLLFELLSGVDWGSLIGGGSGGGVGDFFSSIFGAKTAKAGGGMVRAGQPLMVGELGPEPFIPSVDGFIMPNRVGATLQGGGNGRASITVGGAQVVINGNLDGVTMGQLENTLNNFAKTLPAAIDARVINRGIKGAY